jgi:hypothetical protein
MGRVSLINSGGASSGEGDLAEAIKTAVINKRGGGAGLISGRKAFQRPMNEGAALLQSDPGRVPQPRGHDRLTGDAHTTAARAWRLTSRPGTWLHHPPVDAHRRMTGGRSDVPCVPGFRRARGRPGRVRRSGGA